MNSPIEWARLACDKLMDSYSADELRAERTRVDEKGRRWLVPELEFEGARWRYNHGLFMVALQRTYSETNDKRYLEYTKRWADGRIDKDGKIDFLPVHLDAIQPGLALFMLYKVYGDKRYKIALDEIYNATKHLKKTEDGGYWHHNLKHPHQMWLDGLYMLEPFIMEYYELEGMEGAFERIAEQTRIMTRHTRDEKTGLLYHGWDEKREQDWADPGTGKSPEFWGRALGWYTVTLVDILEKCPKDIPEYDEMMQMFLDVMKAVMGYQDESGMWYQVTDKGDRADNWLETSCSCLFMYSIAKAVRLGFLEEKYSENALKCWEGLFKFIENGDEGFIMYDVCQGTNVGDYEHYIKRGRICNDFHGVGIFVMACIEIEKLDEKRRVENER